MNELHHDLIGVSTSRADLIATLLRNPWLKGRVLIQDGFICLQGRGHLVARRRTQTRLTDQFLADQRGLLERLGHLPFVRMLAFSGARSRRRSTHALGLDLFIICAKRRACTTYALAMLTARLHRRRAFVGGIDVVDTAHLRAWNRGDLFTGHELLHLRPLSGEGMRRVLLDQNDWVFDRFPNARGADALGPWPRSRFGQRVKRAVELGLWPLWECVEWASRAIVSWRYRRRAGGLKRAGARAHGGAVRLHLGDFGARMMERFRKRLRAEGVWDPELSRELAKRGQRAAETRDDTTKRNVQTETSTERASNTAPVD